ncbi:kinase [Priestia megaterium]
MGDRENILVDFKKYEVIGQGKDGVIYQLTSNQCIKIFFKGEVYKKELEAIQVGQSSSIIPRLYDYGPNYIVMECIKGISLAKYLKKNRHITESLVMQLINLFDELKKLNFSRRDTELRHVLMNEQGNLKIIDLKRAFTSNRPIPVKLLTELKELKLSREFLSYVKAIRPSLYQQWKKFDER